MFPRCIAVVVVILCTVAFTEWCPLAAQDPPAEPPVAPESEADTPPVPDLPQKLIRGWPLLERVRQPDGTIETDLMFSLIRWSDGPRGSYRTVLPLYWSHSDREQEEAWSLLLPLYYQSSSTEHWSFWSAPASLGENDEGTSWIRAPGIFPMYRRDADENSVRESFGIPYVLDLESRIHDDEGDDVAFLSFFPWSEPGRSGYSFFQWSQSPSGALQKFGIFPLAYVDLGSAERSVIIWPLLYGYAWDDDSTRHVFVPLLAWANTRGESDYSWNVLLSLWSGGRRGETRWTRFEPLFGSRETATGGSYSILRIYGHTWDDETGLSRHRLLEPLGLFERTASGTRRRFFPFYFAGNQGEDESYLHVPPLYFEQRDESATTRFLAPVYYEHTSESEGARIAFPLYWKFWEPNWSSLTVFPFYSTTRDTDHQLDLFLGPVYVRRRDTGENPLSRDSILWPFLEWSRRENDSHFHLLPLAWFTKEGELQRRMIFPLYYYVADAESEHHWILPFYGRYRRSLAEDLELEREFYAGGAVVETEVRRGNTRVSHKMDILGPLAGFSDNTETETRHSRVLPLWWQTRSPESELTWLMPFYFHRHSPSDDQGRKQSLTLLLGNLWVDSHSEGVHERSFMWPFVRSRAGEHLDRLDVAGLYSSHESPVRQSFRLSPFLFSRQGEESSTDAASRWFHVYSHEATETESRTRVMPFLYSSHRTPEREEWDAAFGLAKSTKTEGLHRERILPFYFYERKETDGELDEERQFIYPFYFEALTEGGDRRFRSILGPVYAHIEVTSDKYDERHVLWPFFKTARGESSSAGRLFPFYSYSRRGEDEGEWRALTLIHGERRAGSLEGIWSRDGFFDLSFVHRTTGKDSRLLAVNPLLFGFRADDAASEWEWDALFHSMGYRRSGKVTDFHGLFLVNGESNPTQSRWRVSPFVYSLRIDEGSLPRLLAAQACHVFTRASDVNEDRWALLGLLATGSRATSGKDSEFRILHKFVRFKRVGDSVERAIEPLFTWESDAVTGRRYFSILKFLYREERESAGSPTRRRLFAFIPLGG